MTEDSSKGMKETFAGWKAKAGEKMKAAKDSKVADGVRYVARGAEEVSVATGGTAALRNPAGAMTPAKNWGAEKAVAGVRGADRAISHAGNTLKATGDRLSGAKDWLQKYGAAKPMGARVQERGNALVDVTLNKPADWAGDAGSWIETTYKEKVAGVFENIGVVLSTDTLAEREEKKRVKAEKKAVKAEKKAEKKAAKSGEVDPRVEAASSVVEGSELMDLPSKGDKAARDFDALPNKNGIIMAEKLLGKAEGIDELTAMKKKVIESRGDKPNSSWDHERRLTDKSEEKQRESIQLGIDMLDLLPDSAEDLDRTTLNNARAKSIKLAQKNRGIIRNLTSIAKRVESRFPDEAEEIRKKLVEITTPLREKNEVADVIYGKVNVDKLMRPASRDLYNALIKSSDTFGGLTKTQQDEVTKDLGATRKEGIDGRNRYERYDSEKNSTYDVALNAYSEYAKVSMAYEAMREHVNANPELACQLVVMAEKVTQAKQALKLASSKLKAELLIKSKQIRDKENNKAYDATHTVQEQASRKDRKDYYSKILKRQADRIKKEGPTVKKINKYIMIAGGATAAAIAGVEGASTVLQSAPELIDLLKQAYSVVSSNVDFSGAATAVGIGGGVFGAGKFAEWLGKKIGTGAEGQSEKVAARSAEDIQGSMEELTTLVDALDDDNEIKSQLQGLLGNMNKS